MPRPLIPDRVGAILDAAEALVLERGYDSVTVEQVAKAAGIGKGAVYREFSSKHAVLDAVLLRCTRRLTEQVRRRVTDSNAPVRLSTVYRFGMEALLDDQLMTAVLLDDRAVLGSHVRAVDDGRYPDRFAWFTRYVEALHGSLHTTARPEAISVALSSFTIGLLSASSLIGPLDRDQLREAIDVVIDMIERGLERPDGAGSAEPEQRRAQQEQRALLDQLSEQLGGD